MSYVLTISEFSGVVWGLSFMLACLAGLSFAAHSASPCTGHLQTICQVLLARGWLIYLRELRLCPSQSFR